MLHRATQMKLPMYILLLLLAHAARDVITSDVIATVDFLADVTSFLKWTDVVLVYDASLPPQDREALARRLSENQVGSVMLYLPFPHADLITSVTSFIHSTVMTSLIFHLEPNSTEIFLKQASDGKALHPHCQWLMLTSLQQKYVMNNFVCHSPCHLGLLFDVTNEDVDTTDVCHPNVTVQSEVEHTEITTESTASLGGKFVVCSYNSMTAMFDHVASWTHETGLQVFGDGIFPDFSRNFKMKKLRIAIWDALPFTKRLSTNGTVRYGGFCMVILDEMARVLNFTYELVEPPDGQFGSPEENGTWNGMVGMVLRGEADMGVGPFSITPERKKVIDFSVPFMEDGGGILTKGGDPDPDLLNVFRPFPLSVWLLTGVAIIVTTLVFFVVNRVSRLQNVADRWPEKKWTLEECLVAIYGSLMNQGVTRHPVRWSGRVVLGCWWLFTILMVSVYTASLAALLTVKYQAHNVNSIHDLAASSLQPLALKGTNWWTLFMTAKKGVYATIGQRMKRGPIVRVNEEAVQLVYEGRSAFLVDNSQIRYIFGHDCQSLHMAHNIFNGNGLGFPLPQNAVYKEAVNSVILKLQEGGFLEAWKSQWWTSSPQCDDERPHVAPVTRLPLMSIGGILILYGCLILLSILCLLLQRCWYAVGWYSAGGCRQVVCSRRPVRPRDADEEIRRHPGMEI